MSELQTAVRSQVIKVGQAWRRPYLPLLTMLTAVALLLLSQFRLAAWAEVSALHHTMQHLLIFSAGIGVGTSGKSLYESRSFRNKH